MFSFSWKEWRISRRSYICDSQVYRKVSCPVAITVKVLALLRDSGGILSLTSLIFNLKFANLNFPRVRKQSRMEKFGHIPWTEKIFSLTRRYFQGNGETIPTEMIQTWGIGFQDNKNLSSLLISTAMLNMWFNSKLHHTLRHLFKTYLGISLGYWRKSL